MGLVNDKTAMTQHSDERLSQNKHTSKSDIAIFFLCLNWPLFKIQRPKIQLELTCFNAYS